MKKLLSFALIAAVAAPLFAQETGVADEKPNQPREERRRESNLWPAFFAVCEFPANPDVTGLRLTIPFSTNVKDEMSGFQVGLYNSIGSGQLLGLQAGLLNEAHQMRGVQAGLVNLCGTAEGFQIGLINRAETMTGYQVGLINVIRDAELQFFPIVNIGW